MTSPEAASGSNAPLFRAESDSPSPEELEPAQKKQRFFEPDDDSDDDDVIVEAPAAEQVVIKELPSGPKAGKRPATDTKWEKHYLGGGSFGSHARASADGVRTDMVVQGYTLYREGAFCSLKPGEAITLQRSTPEAPAAGKKASKKEDTIVRCVSNPDLTRNMLISEDQVQELKRNGRWSNRR